MKINMGSNDVHRDGFLNLDIRKIEGVDIVDDFTKLETIPDWSVDEIIAHNVLEHGLTDEVETTLRLWVRKLVKGGILNVGVPDGELIFNRYLKDGNWAKVNHSIFGNIQLIREWFPDQPERYCHHTLFNRKTLTDLMTKCGLGNIKETHPNHVDNVTYIATKLGGKYCQHDEEEILIKIFSEIHAENKYAIEFGCRPNHQYSNCLLLKESGWTVKFFGITGGAGIIQERFTAENINEIFKRHKVPELIDFMSIDIDGMDYYVWEALEVVTPQAICIEYNRNRPSGVQAYNAANVWDGVSLNTFGSSREEMIRLGNKKGYKLYHDNGLNLFFILS